MSESDKIVATIASFPSCVDIDIHKPDENLSSLQILSRDTIANDIHKPDGNISSLQMISRDATANDIHKPDGNLSSLQIISRDVIANDSCSSRKSLETNLKCLDVEKDSDDSERNSRASNKTYATEQGDLYADTKSQYDIHSQNGRSNVDHGRWRKLNWAILLSLLACIGGLVYLSMQWFSNRSHIEKLEAEIIQLSTELNECKNVEEIQKYQYSSIEFGNNLLNATVQELQAENQDFSKLLNSTSVLLHAQKERADGLQEERDSLAMEIERLSKQVDELSNDMDHFEMLNDELSTSIEKLQQQNLLLNYSNIHYEDINFRLNETVKELEFQNEFLARQNEIYQELNADLNFTAEHLSDEVNRLEQAVDQLKSENDNLASLVNSLQGEIRNLRDLNDDLDNSITNLETQVGILSNETDRLQVLNEDLENIVSFLNETAKNFDETYEEITSFLSEQIAAYRSVVVETMQNTYSQRIANWDCAYRDRFRLEGFTYDDWLPIGDKFYPDVIEYVDERVLSELCLSRPDFELYLDERFVREGEQPPVAATTNHFVRGIQLYTMAAMNYYFPGVAGDDGLTEADWAQASYDCHNLPAEKRFFMM